MLAILQMLGMLVDVFKPRIRLGAENLFLRHQLNIALHRSARRERCQPATILKTCHKNKSASAMQEAAEMSLIRRLSLRSKALAPAQTLAMQSMVPHTISKMACRVMTRRIGASLSFGFCGQAPQIDAPAFAPSQGCNVAGLCQC